MKNEELLQFRKSLPNLNLVLSKRGNDYGLDLSKSNVVNNNCCNECMGILNRKSMIVLFMLFLFTGFSYAQQPACNLSGPLRAYFDPDGGSIIRVDSDVFNAGSNTVYSWEITENNPEAVIASGLKTSRIEVKSGTKGGNFTIKLTVTNPGIDGGSSLSCFCTKSVTVSRNLNYE